MLGSSFICDMRNNKTSLKHSASIAKKVHTRLEKLLYVLKWVRRLTTPNGGEERMKWTRDNNVKTNRPMLSRLIKLITYKTRRTLETWRLMTQPASSFLFFSHGSNKKKKERNILSLVVNVWKWVGILTTSNDGEKHDIATSNGMKVGATWLAVHHRNETHVPLVYLKWLYACMFLWLWFYFPLWGIHKNGEWCSRKNGRGESHVMARKLEEEVCGLLNGSSQTEFISKLTWITCGT